LRLRHDGAGLHPVDGGRGGGVQDGQAAKLAHKDIATLLHEKHGVSGWWAQMVTVEYERARGLRAVHETTSGFSVSVSKTLAADAERVFEAIVDAAKRRRWFPKGALEITSQRVGKSVRGTWKKDARIDFAIYPKPNGKTQLTVAITRLPDRGAVEAERIAWKAAMETLASGTGASIARR
jgi:hypothetical protein